MSRGRPRVSAGDDPSYVYYRDPGKGVANAGLDTQAHERSSDWAWQGRHPQCLNLVASQLARCIDQGRAAAQKNPEQEPASGGDAGAPVRDGLRVTQRAVILEVW